jgi:hypothetical protein
MWFCDCPEHGLALALTADAPACDADVNVAAPAPDGVRPNANPAVTAATGMSRIDIFPVRERRVDRIPEKARMELPGPRSRILSVTPDQEIEHLHRWIASDFKYF